MGHVVAVRARVLATLVLRVLIFVALIGTGPILNSICKRVPPARGHRQRAVTRCCEKGLGTCACSTLTRTSCSCLVSPGRCHQTGMLPPCLSLKGPRRRSSKVVGTLACLA